MDTLYGFELIKEQDIQELHTHVKLFRHRKTGAELLSLENDDENNNQPQDNIDPSEPESRKVANN